MRRNFFISIFFAMSANIASNAQLYTLIDRNMTEVAASEYECLYEYTINRTDAEGDSVKDVTFTILQIGKTMAKFEDYTAFQYDSICNTDAPNEEINRFAKQYVGVANFFDAELFQDFGAGTLTHMECIGINYYSSEESLPMMEWSLSDDTLTVCGYLCNKATTEYGGRKWTAWYTSELPLTYGPWKLTGLPGLIMQATDSTGTHQFTAFSFRKAATPIYKIKTVNMQKVKRDFMLRTKNSFASISNPIKAVPSGQVNKVAQVGNAQGDGYSLILNDIVQQNRPNGYFPLELK